MAAFIATHDMSALPQSFDNNKMVMSQNVTHRDILVLGHKLYQKTIDEGEHTRQISMNQVEQRIWHLAQDEKQKALKESHEKHQLELEKAKLVAKKAQDKAVRAESKRVEALMKKLATQQLQQEREAADVRLKEAIERVKEQFEQMQRQAVQNARQEEIAKAQAEKKQILHDEELKRQEQHQKLQQEKLVELKDLRINLEEEQTVSVEEMRVKCIKEKNQCLEELKQKHLEDIKVLQEELLKKDEEYACLESQIEGILEEKKKVELKLQEVVEGFQQFINSTKGFDPGQSEYLIPDIFRDYLTDNGPL